MWGETAGWGALTGFDGPTRAGWPTWSVSRPRSPSTRPRAGPRMERSSPDISYRTSMSCSTAIAISSPGIHTACSNDGCTFWMATCSARSGPGPDQRPECSNAIEAVGGREDLYGRSLRRLHDEPPHVFHDCPVEPGVDLVDQQAPVLRTDERQTDRQQPPHAFSITADRQPAVAVLASHENATSLPPVTGQEVDGVDLRHEEAHGLHDPLPRHLRPAPRSTRPASMTDRS